MRNYKSIDNAEEAWQMFRKTGNIGYYILYKQIKRK